MVDIKENKNNMVVKDQELVRNARYRLSELGIKVVSVLISMIKVSDDEFTQYNIKVSDFKELVGSNSKNTYDYVDAMTDELMKKPFKIGDEKFNWLSYAKYYKGEDYVTVEINKHLKPYLLGLKKNFLQYDIVNVLSLKSSYVIRLYELCKDHFEQEKRYNKKAKSVTFEFKISKIREQFEIPKSYLYKDIRVNIIDKGVKQFKEKTDIQIEYKEIKLGRRVDAIHITVKANAKGSSDYTRDLNAFKRYVRKNLVNVDLLFLEKHKLTISVSAKGVLYFKETTIDVDAKLAKDMWMMLFNRARKGNLPSMGQGSLL